MNDNSARALIVHDGDSFLLDVDLGYTAHAHPWVRLRNVYCPELKEVGGVEARDFVRDVISDRELSVHRYYTRSGTPVMSFNRYVVDVYYTGLDGLPRSLAQTIIDAGHGMANAARIFAEKNYPDLEEVRARYLG